MKIVDSMAADVTDARTIAEEPLRRGVDEIAGANPPAASANGPLAALF